MADKPNPFLKLMQQVKKDMPAPAKSEVTPTASKSNTSSGWNETIQQLHPPTPKVEEKNTSDSASEGLTSLSISATSISPPAQEKTSLPIVSPQAQRLLGAANDATPLTETQGDGGTTAGGSALVASDMQELSQINTESLEPRDTTKRETNLNVQAAAFGKKLQLESVESVRELADRLDHLLETQAASALAGPGLIETRNYVQSLMVTLKTRPEFDSVIIDKDVRNIMRFIRATRNEALELREIKTVKKSTRAAKKEVTSTKTKGFDQAFKSIMGFPGLPPLNGGK